jgi:Asp-tRNA(Asn)/Glu-tRNA(Gln) amidotransferase A subunit family amidase
MTVEPFRLHETTIAAIHSAYRTNQITCRQLTEWYLKRIDAYDSDGPTLNSIITVNPDALDAADALDTAFAERGLTGPLHGIPVLMKDQVDTVGMPTTLGSVLFKDYRPDRDATITTRLKDAGALILAKTTLGEMGGGDTHGTLFGSTRNPFDRERTAGGSSGGSGVSVSANLGAVAVGQEGLASIRRPSAWNAVVGMRPTLGLVSRAGAFGGWPSRAGSLGPMTRTVEDTARLLDVMVGYDPEDPSTAYGVGNAPRSYAAFLRPDGLRGVRVGVIRQSMGWDSEPDSEDFKKVTGAFDKALVALEAAGASIVDPVIIADLDVLLAKRLFEGTAESFMEWMNRSANPPFGSYDELLANEQHQQIMWRRSGGRPAPFSGTHYDYLVAREELKGRLLKLMADNGLDALVHKTVEHSPTLISDGVNPPYVNQKGAPHLNTYLFEVPSITVPAGFTTDALPTGITFLGRPFSDASMIQYAYAFEQATLLRESPASTPPLSGEPGVGTD